MKRENGFYWVMWGGKWEVCEYNINFGWYIPGFSHEESYDDNHMQKIDERKIINPNE